ncbi:DUF38 domain-containing protein [Caenorhabditis elegans]|uniref:DUF38 domain-containing protein n=1 Tax=Caenorhabditis elegans TaxID=6239 RepID=Q9TYZ7_CAEEL|nr:F-box domain-containing protein [Caenorhabditis elegans]CCD64039.1 F-box domain-containing protein [Caenorhabditis elegans]|eukprot:NP_500353.1 Uncharacterized protein CELE_F58E2.3 [Caenorhabditis elegans]
MSHVLDLFPTKNIKNLIGFKLNHKLDFVGLTLYFQSPGETVSLEYHQKGGHTSITSHEIYEKQLVRDSEFMSVVCKSLKVFLKSSLLIKKLDLEISQLDYEELDKRMSASSQSIQFYDWFIQFLNNHRTGGLKPKLISLLGFTGYQALSIFRHISSNHLEIINLNFRKEDTEIEEHFQEIVKMKQWKHAKYLHLEECCTSIENVLHFQGANFKVDVISIDDLQLMKELSTHSATLKYFNISFNNAADSITDESLTGLFGSPKKHSLFSWEWSIDGKIECSFSEFDKKFSIYCPKACEELRNVQSSKELECTSLCTSELSIKVLHNGLLMKNILSHLGRLDICRLRRTSRGVQKCVDIIKPDAEIIAIEINLINVENVSVSIFDNAGIKKATYEPIDLTTSYQDHVSKVIQKVEKHRNGLVERELCSVNNRWQLGFSLSKFADDLKLNMIAQKSEIQGVRLDFSLTKANSRPGSNKEHVLLFRLAVAQLLDVISTTLQQLDNQIPVKKLSIQVLNQETLIQLLSLLRPSSLKTIEIRKLKNDIISKKSLKLNEAAQLDQWKNAEDILIEVLTAPGQIQYFLHFVNTEINLMAISMRDIFDLKHTFLQSTTFKKFKASFDNSDIDDQIYDEQFLGFPYKRPENPSTNEPSVWFLRMSASTDVLHILYYEHRKWITFSRVANLSVPSDALM